MPAAAAVRSPGSDEARLRDESVRIQALLDELEKSSSATTWGRVQDLVHRITSLYGAGLERVLEHASRLGRMNEALQNELCEDELVASLLILHGLHPTSMHERIQRALDEVRPYLGSHAGGVELLDVTDEGVVRLRMTGSCKSCPSSRATVDHTLRQAIEDAAPDVTRIDVEGSEPLTPKRTGAAEWVPVMKPTDPRHAVKIGEQEVLLLEQDGALLAYVNECPACKAQLTTAEIGDRFIRCACGRRYDVRRAGLSMDGVRPHLTPVPLLQDERGVRVSLPGARG